LKCNNLIISGVPTFAVQPYKSLKVPGKITILNNIVSGMYFTSNILAPVYVNTGSYNSVGLNGINDSGNIVGLDYGQLISLYWSLYTQIPVPVTIGSYLAAFVQGINNSGNLVGYGFQSNYNTYTPLYWNSYTDTPIVLSTSLYTKGRAFSINNIGQIV
jgi:hypothetical protein